MSDNVVIALGRHPGFIGTIRVLAATFVASVIAYGLIFILKISAEFSWRPDCLDMSTWNGNILFVLIQMLGLCFAIRIFGGGDVVILASSRAT